MGGPKDFEFVLCIRSAVWVHEGELVQTKNIIIHKTAVCVPTKFKDMNVVVAELQLRWVQHHVKGPYGAWTFRRKIKMIFNQCAEIMSSTVGNVEIGMPTLTIEQMVILNVICCCNTRWLLHEGAVINPRKFAPTITPAVNDMGMMRASFQWMIRGIQDRFRTKVGSDQSHLHHVHLVHFILSQDFPILAIWNWKMAMMLPNHRSMFENRACRDSIEIDTRSKQQLEPIWLLWHLNDEAALCLRGFFDLVHQEKVMICIGKMWSGNNMDGKDFIQWHIGSAMCNRMVLWSSKSAHISCTRCRHVASCDSWIVTTRCPLYRPKYP